MIEKQFIPYEQAVELKELDFDEKCLGHYIDYTEPLTYQRINGKLNLGFLGQCAAEPYDWNHTPKWGIKSTKYCSASLWQQAFDWFRNEHNIFNQIDVNFIYKIYVKDEFYTESSNHKSYEEARLELLKKLIEIKTGKIK